MSSRNTTRRQFLQQTIALSAAATVPYWLTGTRSAAAAYQSANDRPHIGAIGMGGRGTAVTDQAKEFGEVVAVCDVDRKHAEAAQARYGGKAEIFGDYRKLLERNDIDIIINATPDHWHTAVNVAACKAGKDVYAEKPITLTIDEGKILRRVVEDTKRVVQVGTQQRSEKQFQTAIELVRNGRVGKLSQVVVTLPFWSTKGGPFASTPVPPELDWDFYQGQAPEHEYCFERTHFVNGGGWRWWYEYAGGIMTDWGNHHMDIAHWGMDLEQSGPLTVEGTANFPNGGRPNCYSTPDRFDIQMTYPGDIRLHYEGAEDSRNGIMFIGDQRSRVRESRRCLRQTSGRTGRESFAGRRVASDGRVTITWRNFFNCVKTREKPVSPVEIQHRTITACHLANLAVRLKRKLTWDPQSEEIIGDDEANSWQKRTQRKPYTIDA